MVLLYYHRGVQIFLMGTDGEKNYEITAHSLAVIAKKKMKAVHLDPKI